MHSNERKTRKPDVNAEPQPGLAGQRPRQANTHLRPAKSKHQQMTNKYRQTHPRVGVNSCQVLWGNPVIQALHEKPPRQ